MSIISSGASKAVCRVTGWKPGRSIEEILEDKEPSESPETLYIYRLIEKLTVWCGK